MTMVLELQEAEPRQRMSALEKIRNEFDGYLDEMKKFPAMEPDQVFMRLSGWTARATELRIQLSREQSTRADRLRTKEIDPFIEECERQFRIHSRLHAVRDFDLKLSGGAV